MKTRILLFLSALLTTCSSPQKAFDNQDYNKAYKLALSSLNKDKEDKETRSILKQSLEIILEQQGQESRNLGSSNDPDNWKKALDINYKLQERVKEARAFLPHDFEKEAHTFPRQAQQLRKSLYDYYFEQGLDNLGREETSGLKAYAQHAHGAFIKAGKYAETAVPKLDSLTQAAYKKGIVYYSVETDAPFDVTRHWEIDRVFDNLEDLSGGFLRVAFNEPLKNADCHIEIRFNSLDFDIEEERGDEDFNREIITEYQTLTDTAGNETQVPVYGSVEGNVVVITKTKTASWAVDVYIQSSGPNCSLQSDDFEASVSSQIQEFEASGDERAIPEQYLNASQEVFMPEDDMVDLLLEELYEQIVQAYF